MHSTCTAHAHWHISIQKQPHRCGPAPSASGQAPQEVCWSLHDPLRVEHADGAHSLHAGRLVVPFAMGSLHMGCHIGPTHSASCGDNPLLQLSFPTASNAVKSRAISLHRQQLGVLASSNWMYGFEIGNGGDVEHGLDCLAVRSEALLVADSSAASYSKARRSVKDVSKTLPRLEKQGRDAVNNTSSSCTKAVMAGPRMCRAHSGQ